MKRTEQSSPHMRWFIAVIAALACMGLRNAMDPLLGTALPFVTAFPAVMFAAWYGGFGPGLAAMLVCVGWASMHTLGGHLFTHPVSPALQIALFMLSAVLVCVLAEALRRSRHTAERDAARLEELLFPSQRLAAALDAQAIAAFDVDMDLRCTWAHTHALGLAPDRFVGHRIGDVFEGGVDELEAALRRILETSAPLRQDVTLIHRGRRTVLDWSGRPLLDKAGLPIGVMSIAVDITRRADAEQRLQQADKQKDSFLATLSHELRNPLGSISNAAALLELQAADAKKVLWAAGVLRRQTRAMQRLLDDLLDLSRITQDRIELRRIDVDLADVVTHALEQAQPAIAAAQHRVTNRVTGGGWRVNADSDRLSQVFVSLLSNAAKFTPAGGRIDVAAHRHGNQVEVRITDTGIGIEPNRLERMFEMYAPGGQDASGNNAGLGVGLALVRALLTLHGGSIQAYSEGTGRGSQFVVRLPLVHAPAHASGPAAPDTARAAAPGTARRIWVVDDNVDSAETTARVLRLHGHDVQVHHDGLTAASAGAAFGPDCVLLDLGLGNTDGYQVLQQMRSARWGQHAWIAAMTGRASASDQERTRAAGFDWHIAKPIEPAALLQTLRDLPRFASTATLPPG